jgi:hypothetical protein
MDQQDRPGWNPPEAQVAAPAPASTHSAGPRRSRIGTGIAIAAIGIGALGVAGTAYASSTSPSPAPSADARSGYGATGQQGRHGPGAGMPGMGGPDGHAGGMRGGLGLGLGLGGAIHGTFVTPKQGGGYQTIDTQTGSVTSVSSTSITVRSTDGFTQSYAVDATTIVHAQRDGIGSVKVGDEVSVVATEASGKRTAVEIVDRTQVVGRWNRLAPPRPDGSTAPSSSGTGTA